MSEILRFWNPLIISPNALVYQVSTQWGLARLAVLIEASGGQPLYDGMVLGANVVWKGGNLVLAWAG